RQEEARARPAPFPLPPAAARKIDEIPTSFRQNGVVLSTRISSARIIRHGESTAEESRIRGESRYPAKR
ncbi:hypothetical protein PFISCL1PPCAC_16753, partial [Pristionchus fissidentatus]